MKVNNAINALANIIALIKLTNPGVNPTVANVIIGSPITGSFSTSNGTKNTRLPISAIKNMGYSGSRDIYYNRLSLANNKIPAAFGTYMVVGSRTLAAVRSGICAQMGILESEVTWNSASVPTGGAQTSFVMTAKSDSLVYSPGSTLTVPALHCAAVTEFIITAGSSANTSAGGGLTNRGIKGWQVSGLGLSVAAGSVSGSTAMGGHSCVQMCTPNAVAGDGQDYTLNFSVGVQFNGSTVAPRSLMKKLEMILEDTAGKPMYFEQVYGAGNGYAEGINTSFPSRFDFARGSTPMMVAGTRYRIRLYRM